MGYAIGRIRPGNSSNPEIKVVAMGPDDRVPAPNFIPSPETPSSNQEPDHDREKSCHIRPAPGSTWPLALVAGMSAGLISWGVGEYTRTFFAAGKERANIMGTRMMAETLDTMAVADVKNAALAFGVLGATLGMTMGLAGGLSRGSWTRGTMAALVGLTLGAATVAGITLAVLPLIGISQVQFQGDLKTALLIHGAAWAPIGAVGGLAFGLGMGGRGRILPALVGGLLGAALGTIIYEIVGALALPTSETARPISATWGTRLFARLCVALGAAAGAAMGARSPDSASHPRWPPHGP
jgi:hypothetical protein